MKVIQTAIEGVVILEPARYGDARGYFMESYTQRTFDRLVRPAEFVQDNESRSRYGVVRGLHFQLPPHAQSKLVRVIAGRVLDVAVDIRRGSPTFGRHVAVELTGENHRQLFIPRGFAWDDPALAIDWGLSPHEIILSEKDARHPRLTEATELFDYHTDYYA